MSGLVLPITCGVCGQQFTAPQVADLVTSDAGKERLGSIMETLVMHIRDQHKQQYALAAVDSAQLLRLICLMHYQAQDAGAVQLRDYLRYQLWQKLAKNRPATDDELKAIVGQMAITKRDMPAVLDVLTQCRDIWCEMGQHQPQPIMPPPGQNGTSKLVKP